MSLTSASTIADAYAQWQNNLCWEGDLTKAKNALEAVRFLLACRPQQVAAETGVAIRFESLQSQQAELSKYLKRLSGDVNRAAFTRGHMNLI